MMDIILLIKIAFGLFAGFVCLMAYIKLSIKRNKKKGGGDAVPFSID